MKGEKKTQKKGKSMYVIALCGVLAVSGIVYAGNRNKEKSEQKERDLVDLNEAPQENLSENQGTEQIPQQLTEMDNLAQAGEVVPTKIPDKTTAQENGRKVEGQVQQLTDATDSDADAVEDTISKEPEKVAEEPETKPDTQVAEVPTEPEESQAVLGINASDLRFSAEEGLILPLAGTVLKPYSAEQMIYFETLAQFRTNPAVFLAGESGSEIVAAADGIIVAVENTDKQGVTVTMELGNDYQIVYGQLTEVLPEVGDYVACGEAFATLAEPTKYYSMEGSHLYVQLRSGEATVDPMNFIVE